MARQPEGSIVLAQLQAEYEYDGIETCAVDGSCALPCPVSINTGTLVKQFRRGESTPAREKVALAIASRWARELPATTRDGAAAVYFPACINRIFGRDPGHPTHPSLPQALTELSARAHRPLWIPTDTAGLCCSTPWSSKGYIDGHKWMAAAICDAMWRWTDHGALPVVIDAASCTNGLLDDVKNYLDDVRRARLDQITILDSIAWCHDLLPALKISRRVKTVAVHPTCSTNHLGLTSMLEAIAGQLGENVLVPIGTTCCGTAGDRGLLHPELVVSATRDERAALDEQPADRYVSANRTCEMGMRQATGKPYESFVFLAEELTRPANHLQSAGRRG
jgi:D-lactate dehydrogenase